MCGKWWQGKTRSPRDHQRGSRDTARLTNEDDLWPQRYYNYQPTVHSIHTTTFNKWNARVKQTGHPFSGPAIKWSMLDVLEPLWPNNRTTLAIITSSDIRWEENATWAQHERNMNGTWMQHERNMNVTWTWMQHERECKMNATWLQHDRNMNAT